MIGTNDILQNHDLNGLLVRLDALIGGIFAARGSVVVLLATLTPLSDHARDAEASVYNSGLPLIAAKYQALGDRVNIVDMHGALDAGRDLSDGIHPTRTGYREMAGVWFQALTGAAAPPAPVESSPDALAPVPAASPRQSPSATAPATCALAFSSAVADAAQNAFCLGFKFTTGSQPISVTRLGYLNDGAAGSLARHTVGIYDNATRTLADFFGRSDDQRRGFNRCASHVHLFATAFSHYSQAEQNLRGCRNDVRRGLHQGAPGCFLRLWDRSVLFARRLRQLHETDLPDTKLRAQRPGQHRAELPGGQVGLSQKEAGEDRAHTRAALR